MDFFYFLVLVTNSPLCTSWDYLQNEPPSPKPSSQRLLVGNPARTHGPPYEFSPCTRCACCTGSTQRGGPLLASCLTHVLCTYKLLHGAWDTCLESQSPTWTSSYFEVFTLFLETLVLLATMFISSHGSHSESWAS